MPVKTMVALGLVFGLTLACSHARQYPTRAMCREQCSKTKGSVHDVASGDFALCVSDCTRVPLSDKDAKP
jgi:hypothetical protein